MGKAIMMICEEMFNENKKSIPAQLVRELDKIPGSPDFAGILISSPAFPETPEGCRYPEVAAEFSWENNRCKFVRWLDGVTRKPLGESV